MGTSSDSDLRELDSVALLEQLFGTIRLAARRLNFLRITSGDPGIPAAGLRVLDCIHENGPQTVPQLARQWSTSRQNLQVIVNRLQVAKLIEVSPNPAHKRSVLYRLTTAGEFAARRASVGNSALMAYLAGRFSESELRAAGRVIERMHDSIKEYWVEHNHLEQPAPLSVSVSPVGQAAVVEAVAEEMPVNLL